jgi:hypothetical protein
MPDPVLFKEDDYLLEEVKRFGTREELRVVVHKAISIFVNLESSPGILSVLLLHIVLRGHCTSSVWRAICFGLIALLALLITLVMCFLIDEALTISKVSPDLLGARAWAGHPWVCQYLLESGSVRGVESHHLLKQVLELGSVDVVARLGLSMCLPESCRLSCSDKSIVRVTGVSTGEGRPLSDDHEEDDGGGEEVNAGALIWPSQLDLGSHVGLCTELSLEHARRIAALNRCCKTEICDFEGVVFVEEEVLRLEVTMSDALIVHETQTIHYLLEVVAGGWFAQATAEGDKVEKLTTTYKLEADELDILSSLLRIRLLTLADLD